MAESPHSLQKCCELITHFFALFYKKKQMEVKTDTVKRGINFKYGVDELVNLIKEDGNWIEP